MNSNDIWMPFPTPPNLSKNNYLFGTSGYHFDDWIGVFNPPRGHPDPATDNRFQFYLRYFGFVEINHTFYREPDPAWFSKFLIQCKENTQISVKIHKTISHNWNWDWHKIEPLMIRHVTAVQEVAKTNRFYSFLIQLEDRVTYNERRLEYLSHISEIALLEGLDVHIEFRNITWHQHHILQHLKDRNIGICNTEIPQINRSIFPLKSYATSRKGYIRYSGRNIKNWRQNYQRQRTRQDQINARNKRYDYRYSIEELKERAQGQLAVRQKTDCVAVAFNNHYDAAAVENAITNMNLVDDILNGKQ